MDVFPCGMCIYSKKCPCRTILAFLALLKKILRLPLWHGTKTERKDYIPVRDNWIGKKATEAANAIAKERNFVQSQDIGKVNKAEIKEAMDGVLKKMQGFDFTKFKEELGKRGFKVREARASTGKLNGYYVTARSGTEYKASEIGKGYTLAHIERTQSKLKCNSMNISHGNKLTPGSGSFQR
ncbi:relaxase/mobilization nuclease domain-containing protein [Phocaeicola vulgatus]|nr:relaxase/mobilization nuclease domain-containing protein [Phocaeicola vulgatus]